MDAGTPSGAGDITWETSGETAGEPMRETAGASTRNQAQDTTAHKARSKTVVVSVMGGETANTPAVVDPDVPLVYADDLAAVRGDGVFETLMLRQGVVHKLDRHSRRFVNSAAMLNLPEPDIALWHRATEVAAQAFQDEVGAPEAALRWVYSRGREATGQPSGWITVAPISAEVERARKEGVDVMTAERGFRIDLSQRSPWALVGAKTLSYAANMAALRTAKERGYTDVIFISNEGHVLEGPTSSVIAVQGKTLLTPPTDAGILPSTTQAAIFHMAEQDGWETQQKPLTVADLVDSDGVWLVSSVRAYARVNSIDGQLLDRPDRADQIEAMVWRAVTS